MIQQHLQSHLLVYKEQIGEINGKYFQGNQLCAEPASAGTPYVMYTAAGSTTTVVLGLILANTHTTAVTALELVSTTANRGGANNVSKWYINVSQRCNYSKWIFT